MNATDTIKKAQNQYQTDDIEVDEPTGNEERDELKLSRGEGGCWVQAWVWVPEED